MKYVYIFFLLSVCVMGYIQIEENNFNVIGNISTSQCIYAACTNLTLSSNIDNFWINHNNLITSNNSINDGNVNISNNLSVTKNIILDYGVIFSDYGYKNISILANESSIGVMDGYYLRLKGNITLNDLLFLNLINELPICDFNVRGSIIYYEVLDMPCYCNSTSWNKFEGGIC